MQGRNFRDNDLVSFGGGVGMRGVVDGARLALARWPHTALHTAGPKDSFRCRGRMIFQGMLGD